MFLDEKQAGKGTCATENRNSATLNKLCHDIPDLKQSMVR